MKGYNITRWRNLWVVCCAFCVVSCDFDPAAGDYDQAINTDYRLFSTSRFQTVIINVKIGTGIGVEPVGVPANVVEIAWNDRFIVAKQQEFRLRRSNPNDNYLVPVPDKYNFWIIDIAKTNRLGPLSMSELGECMKDLGIGNLKLTAVDRAKKS
jgi:hypothetical protein